MESNTNRFVDNEDLSVDDCDLKQLMSDCEKWSHKNDLQLLTHLKQMSNHLINKTENTNQSIDNLVFETKMHCVKVDNVINEFQMLANSQFVENRVYDEEMEDVITSPQNLPNEDSVNNKSKEEEVMSKIKVALNIGLDFLNQRFDCVSNKVSQNDSDDENDQILEGLISNSARDEYSQRLLPYIIGSEEFIKDNYVGLSCVEESPAIDLKTKMNTDLSDKSVNSFEVKNSSNTNNFIDDINDSDEEPNDLFGTIPKREESDNLFGIIPKTEEPNDLFGNIPEAEEADDLFGTIPKKQQNNNLKSASISDESDSEPFISEDREVPKEEIKDSNPLKPSMPSFHDELSAAISAKNPKSSSSVKKETQTKSVTKSESTKRVPEIESESSDENESIFNVTKTKPKSEDKPKDFSNLFGEEPNDDSLFASNLQKQTPNKQIKVSPKIAEKTSNLFDDDDDEEDDLFGAISKKTTKPILNKPSEEKRVSNSYTQKVEQKKPLVSKQNLFSDDEEEDDLFSAISSKPKPNDVQNSNAFESVVKPTLSSVKPSKPTDSLIGELSSALKNKGLLFQSDDEESDSNSDNFFENKTSKIKNERTTKSPPKSPPQSLSQSPPKNRTQEINAFNTKEEEEKEEPIISDNHIISEKTSSEIKTNDSLFSKPSNESNLSNEFYSEEPTLTLSNDGLKHRAALGAKRNRRPPTKRILKLTPITDFDQNSEANQEVIASVGSSPPVAAIRTVKTNIPNPMSDEFEDNSEIKFNESTDRTLKSMSALIKSPSTEEDDIFPTQTSISKNNQNISKMFEKSENGSLPLFDDSKDNEESLFSSNKSIKNIDSKKTIDNNRGLFDTSDSDEDNIFSNKSSNLISNIIKASNSEVFNDVSSTDSSLSNTSDLKIGNSKPAVSLFSDSEDDDLFSAVNKTKTIDKNSEKEPTIKTEVRAEVRNERSQKTTEKIKKTNSLFSDDEEEEEEGNTNLFEKKEIKSKPKTNVKPIFDLEDDDDEDIFAPKSSTTKTTKTVTTKNKAKKEERSQSSDLFDDPLFASRS